MSTPEWSGRVDGDGPEHLRMHQHVVVEAAGTSPTGHDGIALVGFACDAGVARNKGRVGAAEGPAALRRAIGPLAVHRPVPVADLGDVVVTGDELEAGQDAVGALIARGLDEHGLVVVLGGGHETAWGSYLGRTTTGRLDGARVGVLNLDAHFDLRLAERPSSGTPFRQMASADEAAGREFRYMVAGISRASNTATLFETAERLGTTVVLDVDCQPRHLDALLATVDGFVADVDVVHLSIDLDLLPAAVAPGVSAPAGYGVPMEVVDAVCAHVAATGKLVLVDVVELCPPMDVDGRTARAAARLVHTITEQWLPAAGTENWQAPRLRTTPHHDKELA